MTNITTFWSATGGVGKTTLAIAQAIMLARGEKNKVALLDFNEATPNIHRKLSLRCVDLTQIYDAIEQENLTADTISPCLQKKHGIWVLTGISFQEFDRFEERHFSTIIQVLKNEFSHVVIDCNAGIFFASTLASLRNSDEIKVVTLPTSDSVKNTITFMDFIQKNWGIKKEKYKVILNMIRPGGVSLDGIKALFNTDIHSIKYDPQALKLQETGKIFMPSEMNISKNKEKPRKGFFGFSILRGKTDVDNKHI